jgi:hypothetical protein
VSQELQQLQAEEQRARQEVAAADQAERSQRLALQQVRRRQYEAQSALTQLTQQPPPELTAATQAGGDEALQADIWQVRCPGGDSWLAMPDPVACRCVRHSFVGQDCPALLLRCPVSPPKAAPHGNHQPHALFFVLSFAPACLQAAQACIDLELQLRERQAELEQAQQAEAEAHASFDESRCAPVPFRSLLR